MNTLGQKSLENVYANRSAAYKNAKIVEENLAAERALGKDLYSSISGPATHNNNTILGKVKGVGDAVGSAALGIGSTVGDAAKGFGSMLGLTGGRRRRSAHKKRRSAHKKRRSAHKKRTNRNKRRTNRK